MRRLIIAAVLQAALAASAARAETVLSLSNTASVAAQPDQIVAVLRAEAAAPNPAAAQESVNRMMAQALARAKSAPGIEAATAGYDVWSNAPQRGAGSAAPAPAWHAAQVLRLHGQDGAAMLGLVGALQAQGLAAQQLEWVLSDRAAAEARAQATRRALEGLRARAEQAAAVLGLRFASFRSVQLNPAEPAPRPLAFRAMAAGAPTSPPSAERGPVEISATVAAEALLTPPEPSPAPAH